jgi:hypothetical protein
MAIHPDFSSSPYSVLDPEVNFPDRKVMQESRQQNKPIKLTMLEDSLIPYRIERG